MTTVGKTILCFLAEFSKPMSVAKLVVNVVALSSRWGSPWLIAVITVGSLLLGFRQFETS